MEFNTSVDAIAPLDNKALTTSHFSRGVLTEAATH
jgi:hypothetical protein